MIKSSDEKSKKSCIIIGNGDFNGLHPDYTADYVIAADTLQIKKADLIVGDFDSIDSREVPPDIETVQVSAEKDFSDLELAVNEAIKRGYDCLYIYGALGGRFDHSLASLAVLRRAVESGLTAYLIGVNEIVTAVVCLCGQGAVTLPIRDSGYVSVFPVNGDASGVTITGLKYSLDNADLSQNCTVGLSNEFVGEEAVVTVKDGMLLVLWCV